jgi:hypothetical protein
MKNGYEIQGNDVFIVLGDKLVTVLNKSDLPLLECVTALYTSYDQTLNGYYVMCYVDGKMLRLTTYLLQPGKGLEVDHIDRDTLNNRRCNLRVVTHSVNVHNQRLRPDNTSGYKGVSWVPHCRKYRARIQLDGKKVHLGMFDDPKEASLAVEAVRNKYVGGVLCTGF